MSASRLSLSSKPLIATVVVLLAVVVVFNVRTFSGAGRSRSQSDVRVQASPPYPMDLADVVRSSGMDPAQLLSARGVAPELTRDPFTMGRQAKPVTTTTSWRRNAARRRTKPATLHCDAVFPGGSSPAVLIQGKAYRVGDKVAGYTVRSIGAAGVKLVNGSGKQMFLAVGTNSDEKGTSGLITNLPDSDRDGRTRLVEYEHSERKIP